MKRQRYVATIVAAAVVAGWSTPTAPAPPPGPTMRAPEAKATDAALAAYNAFWDVVSAAQAAPKAKDWTSDLATVASGEALADATNSVRNYAVYPRTWSAR